MTSKAASLDKRFIKQRTTEPRSVSTSEPLMVQELGPKQVSADSAPSGGEKLKVNSAQIFAAKSNTKLIIPKSLIQSKGSITADSSNQTTECSTQQKSQIRKISIKKEEFSYYSNTQNNLASSSAQMKLQVNDAPLKIEDLKTVAGDAKGQEEGPNKDKVMRQKKIQAILQTHLTKLSLFNAKQQSSDKKQKQPSTSSQSKFTAPDYRPTSAQRPPKPPSGILSPKNQFSQVGSFHFGFEQDLRQNTRVRSSLLLDPFKVPKEKKSFQNLDPLTAVDAKLSSRYTLKNMKSKNGQPLEPVNNVYQSVQTRRHSRNSMTVLSAFERIASTKKSMMSLKSHNTSSYGNLSFRSHNSPVRATRDSFDLELVRQQAERSVTKQLKV